MSTSLDSDRVQRFVWPDAGLNCLHLGYQQTTLGDKEFKIYTVNESHLTEWQIDLFIISGEQINSLCQRYD